jgi:hypothetical protein
VLYCKACQNMVPSGEARCYLCQNGFVNQLACATCHADVPRGSTGCARCDGQHAEVMQPPPPPTGYPPPPQEYFPGRGPVHSPPPRHPHSGHSGQALVPVTPGVSITINQPGTLPAIPHLPRGMALPTRVPESYLQRSHGATSEVVMNGEDASILTEMGNLSALLHVMAGRMNELQGHMPSTRQLIRKCRDLSTDIQEEIEVRLGPQGPLRTGR